MSSIKRPELSIEAVSGSKVVDEELSDADVDKTKAIINGMSTAEKKVVIREIDPVLLLDEIKLMFEDFKQRDQKVRDIFNL